MKRVFGVALLGGWLLGASPDTPAWLLTRPQMVLVLADLELARALVEGYTQDKALASELLQKNRELIYKLHGVDIRGFQKSCQYYSEDLEVFKEIYDEVINCLETLEADAK